MVSLAKYLLLPRNSSGQFQHAARSGLLLAGSAFYVQALMQQTVVMEPGQTYHVYICGNNRETIFRSKENYYYFLQLYRKYMALYVDTFAYWPLPKHVLFLVRVKPEEELKSLLATAAATKQVSV